MISNAADRRKGLVCALALAAGCAGGRALRVEAPSPSEVLAELSRRSAVPEEELKARLSRCESNQQNLYFCAFRDFVTVDLQLERTAAEQLRRHPECKELIDRQLRDLRRQRDRGCEQSASEEYGEGSLTQTAMAICAASTTKPMIEQLEAISGCAPSSS